MKRKLISFDAFKKIEEASLTNAQKELVSAAEVLGRTLGENLELHTFNDSSVTYQSEDGSFVHANYDVSKNKVVFENIEKLVIEEESEKSNARETISKLVDSLLEDNEIKATQYFEQYLNMPFVKRNLVSEAVAHKSSKKMSKMKKMRMMKDKMDEKTHAKSKKKAGMYARKVMKSTMKEWANVSENVLNYIDYKEFGPEASQSMVKTDGKGNVTGFSIPTLQTRNENKLLSFNWKTLDTEVKVVRNKNKTLAEDQNFVKAMVELKRYNNISDNSSLEETLEAIVTKWPNLLYATETELSSQIANALEAANTTNYDDYTCNFMAEAILRTAHHAYTDRVKKIATLAGVDKDVTAECKTCEDAYQEFKVIANDFYAKLDEQDENELKIFKDLYQALSEVYQAATQLGDDSTTADVRKFLFECESVLNREAAVDLKLAEAIAVYLNDITESNLLEPSDEESVHHTVNGDHPRTSFNAKQTAVASNNTGDWRDAAPVSDGKSYNGNLADEMGTKGHSNIGGNDVYPSLSNPYVPKSGEFKMKEKSAIDDVGTATWQSNDTWPNLNNPYVPSTKK